jgi:hypothetical protein
VITRPVRCLALILTQIILVTPAIAGEKKQGWATTEENPGGVTAGASGFDISQAQADAEAIALSSPVSIACARARPSDGGVPLSQLAASASPDCVAFVLLRAADSVILGPSPEPVDLLPAAFDKARDLAVSPTIEIAPARLGLTGLASFFWLAEEPPIVSATAEVPGLSVTAEATPVRYVWHFGDGSNLVTDHPGRPWTFHRPGNVAHTYETKAIYDLTAEVVYEARWRTNGGPWQPLGFFSTADSTDYQVQELIAVLARSRR